MADLDADQKQEISDVYKYFDKDGTGITAANLDAVARYLFLLNALSLNFIDFAQGQWVSTTQKRNSTNC
jgi:hypothetical protein